jgi:flagellar motor switch protein FliN/FliY
MMTMTVKKIEFPQDQYLNLVQNMEMKCFVRLGTVSLSIAELSQLKTGYPIILDQKTEEPVEIILNNHVIARGELKNCDDYFAVQITEVAI